MDADVVRCFLRQQEFAVRQPAAAEWRVARLFDDVDGDGDLPVELVAFELGGDVRDEFGKVIGPVAIGHDDRKPFRIPRIGGAGVVRSHAPVVGRAQPLPAPDGQTNRFAREGGWSQTVR